MRRVVALMGGGVVVAAGRTSAPRRVILVRYLGGL